MSPRAVPAQDPLGQLAVRRITDATNGADPLACIKSRLPGYTPGDTDLAWSRITYWRALLTSAIDLPPHEPITSALVSGLKTEPALDVLAGWLASRIDGPVRRAVGELKVELVRNSETVTLSRPQDGVTATLSRTARPEAFVPLPRRETRECLAEDLRRLDRGRDLLLSAGRHRPSGVRVSRRRCSGGTPAAQRRGGRSDGGYLRLREAQMRPSRRSPTATRWSLRGRATDRRHRGGRCRARAGADRADRRRQRQPPDELSPRAGGTIDWAKVHLFWGDERYVTEDDDERNEKQARDALLRSHRHPGPQRARDAGQ